MLALISLGLFGAAAAQDYRQWDEEKLREELGRVADATRKINVPMRDGVHLSTDVYLPKDSHNALPTVFWRTPYNYNILDAELLPQMLEAVSHGYAFVIQNERGRYFSEGEFEILGNPRTDGYIAESIGFVPLSGVNRTRATPTADSISGRGRMHCLSQFYQPAVAYFAPIKKTRSMGMNPISRLGWVKLFTPPKISKLSLNWYTALRS